MFAEVARLRSEELWLLALGVASVAVVVLAVLLGLVIAALQRIDRNAARTYTAAKELAQSTVALWTLDQMNRDLVAIRDAARGAQRTGVRAAPPAAPADKVEGWLGEPYGDDDKRS